MCRFEVLNFCLYVERGIPFKSLYPEPDIGLSSIEIHHKLGRAVSRVTIRTSFVQNMANFGIHKWPLPEALRVFPKRKRLHFGGVAKNG